jgi:hypothetical protein
MMPSDLVLSVVTGVCLILLLLLTRWRWRRSQTATATTTPRPKREPTPPNEPLRGPRSRETPDAGL